MSDAEWSARARSFGSVAEDYDRFRPGYPDALVADVLALAPGHRVLEAGAGTGRATLALAEHGATVTAVEHDDAMATIARRRTAGLPVVVETARFEDHRGEPGEADLVACAQAWHWVDQAAGAAVAARSLREDGVLACWWNYPSARTGPIWDAIADAYAREAPELRDRTEGRPDAPGAASFDRAPGFTAWTDRFYDRDEHYDAAGYTGMLATYSDHIRLPDGRRERLLAAIADAVEGHGGTLTYPYRTILVWARRER